MFHLLQPGPGKVFKYFSTLLTFAEAWLSMVLQSMVVVPEPFTYLMCASTAVLKTEKNGADNLLASHGLSKIYEFLLSRGHDTYLKELPDGLELFKYACSFHTQLDILTTQFAT